MTKPKTTKRGCKLKEYAQGKPYLSRKEFLAVLDAHPGLTPAKFYRDQKLSSSSNKDRINTLDLFLFLGYGQEMGVKVEVDSD